MSRTIGKDNPRERAIRSLLHGRGLRFRIHHAAVAGTRRTIDIAFTRLRLAVFCDGCFWHGCPIHATTPKTNRGWWIAKITANAQRDRDTNARLATDAWSILRIWEHVSADEAVLMILARLEELEAVHSIKSCTPPDSPWTRVQPTAFGASKSRHHLSASSMIKDHEKT